MSCVTIVEAALERNTFLVLLFLFSMSDVLLFCWIFKLSAFADIVPLLCLWNISCSSSKPTSTYSEDILSLWLFVLIWMGGKSFIHVIVFSCGCLESEWIKMHLCHILRKCPGSCSSLRKESWKCNTGSFELTARTQCSWAMRHSARSFRTREKSNLLLGRKSSCDVTQMHVGNVSPHGICVHMVLLLQLIENNLPSL